MPEANITWDFLTLVALGVSWIQMWALIWANSSPKMHGQSSFYFDRWHRDESQRDKVINRWRESVISVSPGIPPRPLSPLRLAGLYAMSPTITSAGARVHDKKPVPPSLSHSVPHLGRQSGGVVGWRGTSHASHLHFSTHTRKRTDLHALFTHESRQVQKPTGVRIHTRTRSSPSAHEHVWIADLKVSVSRSVTSGNISFVIFSYKQQSS